MCAQYDSETRIALLQRFGLVWASDRVSECPAQMFPRCLGAVIRLRDGEPGLDAMAWTLLPGWASTPEWKKFRQNFNARAETIDTLPSFRASFEARRCLVPAAAFAEFPVVEGLKVKHRVERADGEPMFFAGIWDRWTDRKTEITTFTVVTTEPHEGLRWLHHRVPVVLSESARDAWIDPRTTSRQAKSLLTSPEPETLSISPW